MATHLGAAFAAFAVIPFYLAYRGAPTIADSLVLASALAPLAGACIVARTGRLEHGRAITICGLVCLSLILWFRLGAGFGVAAAWLVAAQVEALGNRRLSIVTALIAAAALFVMGALPAALVAPSDLVDAIFSALALAYAATAAFILSPTDSYTLAQAEDERSGASERTSRSDQTSWAAAAALAGGQILEFDERGTVLALHGAGVETVDPNHIMQRGFFDHVHVADRPAFLKLIADAADGASCVPAWIRLRSWDANQSTGHRPTYRRIEMRVLPGARGEQIIALVRDGAPVLERGHDRMTEIRHDLRTPLNAIIGFSEMLASRTMRPADVDKQFEYARMVHRSGQALLTLIDANVGGSPREMPSITTLPAPKLPDLLVADSAEHRMVKRA